MSNAWEHFFGAAAVLASAGPVKHRLVEAYRMHLSELDEADLPKELREEFSSLTSSLSCVRPMRGETAVQATVRKMSDKEAGGCAVRIIDMLGVLARQHHAHRPMLRAVGDE